MNLLVTCIFVELHYCKLIFVTHLILIFVAKYQPAITCSKLTIETLEQGVNGFVLISLLLTLNIFHTLFLRFYC